MHNQLKRNGKIEISNFTFTMEILFLKKNQNNNTYKGIMVKFSSIMIGLTQNKKNNPINTNNIEPQPFWDSSVLVPSC